MSAIRKFWHFQSSILEWRGAETKVSVHSSHHTPLENFSGGFLLSSLIQNKSRILIRAIETHMFKLE